MRGYLHAKRRVAKLMVLVASASVAWKVKISQRKVSKSEYSLDGEGAYVLQNCCTAEGLKIGDEGGVLLGEVWNQLP